MEIEGADGEVLPGGGDPVAAYLGPKANKVRSAAAVAPAAARSWLSSPVLCRACRAQHSLARTANLACAGHAGAK